MDHYLLIESRDPFETNDVDLVPVVEFLSPSMLPVLFGEYGVVSHW